MSFSSQNTQQKFPFEYDDVFEALLDMIPQAGFQLKSSDKVIGRITASAGMSLFSWGEHLSLTVEKLDEHNTLVTMESSLKVGLNVAGSHRHTKNFNKIIEALRLGLQSS